MGGPPPRQIRFTNLCANLVAPMICERNLTASLSVHLFVLKTLRAPFVRSLRFPGVGASLLTKVFGPHCDAHACVRGDPTFLIPLWLRGNLLCLR